MPAPPALAATTATAPSGQSSAAGRDPAELEREAQAIEQLLRCPVCNGESVAESQTAESAQMRAEIRQMLAEGKTRQQILDYYVRNFGIWILNEPPRQGPFLAIWLLPLVALLGGGAALAFWLRSRLRWPSPEGGGAAGGGGGRAAEPVAAPNGRTGSEAGSPGGGHGADEVERELRRWL
ncbi:MAG: cytochrome c-type biogenesis protein CcmH [Bacillota bacterium]|nr:cytochrome c-type biogenesis protein CcmH [Bacillota bacterium]